MERRKFLQQTTMAGAGLWIGKWAIAKPFASDFPVVRIPEGQRKFKSKTIEKIIGEVQDSIGNKELAWLFGNCFPNTLDTTVDYASAGGKPDTYVITGDIDAMWLRDSAAQVSPYLPYCKEDREIGLMVKGVINRQVQYILLDPYANAFYKNPSQVSEWKSDLTDMKPGVHERKWEIDSLCYPVHLSYHYWKTTGDASIFDESWEQAMEKIIQTFLEQQRVNGNGPYKFQRSTPKATDTLGMGGYGNPSKANGLICSAFRPSDDATIFPYLIPSNLFASKVLQELGEIWEKQGKTAEKVNSARELGRTVWQAVQTHGTIYHAKYGKIYVYECNGYGSYSLMDDANAPSLLSLPYLGAVIPNEITYQNTRKYVLSQDNPYYYKGDAAEGIGSPHTLQDMIWPIGIIMRGLTSTNDEEIKQCLDFLRTTHAGTGFMHESFNKDMPMNFSRKWFAWANSLFGEFILKVYREKKSLLD